MDDQAFSDLIQRVRAGDESAATELVEAYGPEIRAYVHRRLNKNPGLRRLLDSSDILQSAMARFFRGVKAGKFDLQEPRSLARLLTVMARNSLVNQAKRGRAQKRKHPGNAAAGSDQMRRLRTVPDPELTPSEIVSNREILGELFRRLPPFERDLTEQRRQGRSWTEIASNLGHRDSPAALRKRWNRAVQEIKRALGLSELEP